ncbi:MAG: exo-alpha-sialidase, partial [Victivallales bacterium]|nr:exo-alpha-sialidase [Victivallales bacterium]
LMGKWQSDGKLSWTSSKRIYGDPNQTTRGLYEPTLAFLDNQRILCVMRGSNAGKPDLPGVKWHSISEDGGETWTKASPWSYDDGTIFYSPSSCSQLLPLLDDRLFWIGNINKTNVVANSPRYPLFIAEVDKTTGHIIKNSVFEIDTKKDNESPYLTLSNFFALQDRDTGDVLLYMSRFFANDFRDGTKPDFTSQAYCYRISI